MPGRESAVTVHLLGGFRCLLAGEPFPLPLGSQRLLAFLALHDRPVQRSFVAANLWLEKDEARAAANLRSALWRLGQLDSSVVTAEGAALVLDAEVAVDVRDLQVEAYRLAGIASAGALPERVLFDHDLLPDWYDEWLLLERERVHQLRLHALDLLSVALVADGRHALAIDAACASIAGEPLRESAHRALIGAHLAAGNRVEAVRQYERFRVSLRDAVGMEPTDAIRRLLEDALAVAST
jgi:DNA-binding SARP family transcriptional activator